MLNAVYLVCSIFLVCYCLLSRTLYKTFMERDASVLERPLCVFLCKVKIFFLFVKTGHRFMWLYSDFKWLKVEVNLS